MKLETFATGTQAGRATMERAVPQILDTLAVTIAGGAEQSVRRLEESLVSSGAEKAKPSFWSVDQYSEHEAGLLIGTASHALDYDDVSPFGAYHPSAPILSAMLSMRESKVASGKTFLTAFVVGTELGIRMAQALGFGHYNLGFHTTATVGVLGAAVAAARLAGLTVCETQSSLAIAASSSSGLRSNFGTAIKPLHVGFAAANGVRAARLARGGMGGANDWLEGSGFLRAYSGGKIAIWPADIEFANPWAVDKDGVIQKRYPCCYMLHKIIEATLEIRKQAAVQLDDVISAEICMPKEAALPLIHPIPESGMQALFSVPYVVAACLADGYIDLTSFSDQQVRRPALRNRLYDVSVVESPGTFNSAVLASGAPVRVSLVLRSGETVSRVITDAPGSSADPLTRKQLKTKWVDCLRYANPFMNAAVSEALFEEGEQLAAMKNIGDWLLRLVDAFDRNAPARLESGRRLDGHVC